jgi:helicase
MKLSSAKKIIPEPVYSALEKEGICELRPSQEKSIRAGLFSGSNLLVCTPTASGKTLVGEMAIIYSLSCVDAKKHAPIAVYVVPLRALASEKYRSFSKKYPQYKITLTSGDMDSDDRYLADYDIIITTSEKLDSLIRHHAPWLSKVRCLVVDEIHLLNDVSRGPTLEILLSILRSQNTSIQIIGLSATIGNPEELASWLDAQLVVDTWRPVELRKAIFHEDTLYFEE